MPPLLRMHNISKEFSGVRVLHGVDFELGHGEVMALMGENGAGKSTLMKIASGVLGEWEGSLWLDGTEIRFKDTREAERARVAIIHQELNLIPELTVAENILLGREPVHLWGTINYPLMHRIARGIMSELHFTPPVTTPVARLRMGHRQQVEIGRALSLHARIVIMDEPTSALCDAETEVLFAIVRKLRDRGVSIVYISHRIGEVFTIADRVTVLRDGQNVGVHDVQQLRRDDLIRLMVGRDVTQFFVKEGNPQQEVAMKATDITRRSIEAGGRAMVEHISFEVRKGEVVGIAGLLGAGRTELLEALVGIDAEYTSGSVEVEGELADVGSPQRAIKSRIVLISEDRQGKGLVMSMSVKQNITLAALQEIVKLCVISEREEIKFARVLIDRLDIQVHDIDQSVASLSGGNQQKTLLAKWLATHPKILLLDEPTRGIDVGCKHEIYLLLSALSRQGMAIVLASSEIPELLSLCDRIMVMREGRISATFSRSEATHEKIMDAAAPIA